jgi:hypothetical protein
MELAEVRMRLVSFAQSQIQQQNHSTSSNPLLSHRPKHEQESIEKEIRKHTQLSKQHISPKASFGPIHKPNRQQQKLYMLNDIVFAPTSQSAIS